MDLQLAFENLTDYELFPRAAMIYTREHLSESVTNLLALLDIFVSGADRSEEAQAVLLPILYLLAEHQESRAFPSFCHFLLLGDLVEDVMGDAVTQHLARMLISTFDGNGPSLRFVVESETADERPLPLRKRQEIQTLLLKEGIVGG
jgi:hypothetical protein